MRRKIIDSGLFFLQIPHKSIFKLINLLIAFISSHIVFEINNKYFIISHLSYLTQIITESQVFTFYLRFSLSSYCFYIRGFFIARNELEFVSFK